MGQSFRFPWAPVRSPASVLECPQLAARSFFADLELPEGGRTLTCPGLPFRTGTSAPWKPAPPPQVGEHNRRIYHEEMGIPLTELERLRAQGVI